MFPSDRVAQLCSQAQGSVFCAFYDSQGYGGIIITHLDKDRFTRMTPEKFCIDTLKQITVVLFHIFSISSLKNHPKMRCYPIRTVVKYYGITE
jgi:hypothetical protein